MPHVARLCVGTQMQSTVLRLTLGPSTAMENMFDSKISATEPRKQTNLVAAPLAHQRSKPKGHKTPQTVRLSRIRSLESPLLVRRSKTLAIDRFASSCEESCGLKVEPDVIGKMPTKLPAFALYVIVESPHSPPTVWPVVKMSYAFQVHVALSVQPHRARRCSECPSLYVNVILLRLAGKLLTMVRLSEIYVRNVTLATLVCPTAFHSTSCFCA
ncbi:hypothetical protein EDD22DRAFT_530325 [Suillus occidentalis]|nr:hypothetical protein EDD22DRAFT_530325 [Suillus occidentalis]